MTLSSSLLVPGRVAPGDCSLGAPTDPYVPCWAYGSSHHEVATGWYTEWTTRGGGSGNRSSIRVNWSQAMVPYGDAPRAVSAIRLLVSNPFTGNILSMLAILSSHALIGLDAAPVDVVVDSDGVRVVEPLTGHALRPVRLDRTESERRILENVVNVRTSPLRKRAPERLMTKFE